MRIPAISDTWFFSQLRRSLGLIGREAMTISGVSRPTPAQKSLKPPPVPVDSITGVAKAALRPNCSAAAVMMG